MSFIQLEGLNEVAEPQIQPEGSYDLVISDVEDYVNDNGRTIIRLRLEFEGNDEAASFLYWISLPKEDDEIETQKLLLLSTKRCLAAFGISIDDGFDPSDLVGATGNSAVSVEIPEGMDNEVNVLKLPKLK